MALPTVETLLRAAARTGHAPDIIEKVARLLDMLKEINGDPALAGRLALKGGTALNVFHLNLDRLSVDIDFNYVGAPDREAMMIDRPGIEAAIDRLLFAGGYSVRRRPEAHGGGKWVAAICIGAGRQRGVGAGRELHGAAATLRFGAHGIEEFCRVWGWRNSCSGHSRNCCRENRCAVESENVSRSL